MQKIRGLYTDKKEKKERNLLSERSDNEI